MDCPNAFWLILAAFTCGSAIGYMNGRLHEIGKSKEVAREAPPQVKKEKS